MHIDQMLTYLTIMSRNLSRNSWCLGVIACTGTSPMLTGNGPFIPFHPHSLATAGTIDTPSLKDTIAACEDPEKVTNSLLLGVYVVSLWLMTLSGSL